MKIRLLRLVWIVSLSWLALLVYGGTFGTAQGELTLNLIVFGWPAFLGLICCYVLNGGIGWPQDKQTVVEQQPESLVQTLLNIPIVEPKQHFLNQVEKSRKALQQSLENSKNQMLKQWEKENNSDLKKLEKIKEVIRESGVISSASNIIKKTYLWNSWITNQGDQWKPDEWIYERVKFPIEKRHQELLLPDFFPNTGETISTAYKLESCFGFIDENKNHITLFIYELISNYIDGRGRLLIKVDNQLVLDVEAYRDDKQYDLWRGFSEINFCKPDIWISSIINLSTEFDGQYEISQTKYKIEYEKHQININLKS